VSKKAKALLYDLIDSLLDNDWTENDVKELLGKATLRPKSFPSSSLYEITSLYKFWLDIHMDGGGPHDISILEDIANLTVGERARYRQETIWRDERVKVYGIEATKQTHGPATGWPIISLRLSTCNLRCPACPHPGTWDEGKQMSSIAISDKVTGIHNDEHLVVLSGGEPLIWQDRTSLLRLMYIWAKSSWQVHLETNGTLFPKKVFRDAFGLITVSPDIKQIGGEEYWAQRINWWENTHPPIWSPRIPADKKLQKRIEKLFYKIEPDRVYPKSTPGMDPKIVKNICNEMSWKYNILH